MATWQLKKIIFTVKRALKYPFLRKGMGIDLPIMIAHKEWGLKSRYLQFAVGHEKRGLNPRYLQFTVGHEKRGLAYLSAVF